MHFNDAASSNNPTPTLPCMQGREPLFVRLKFNAWGETESDGFRSTGLRL
jgi:hypothetical protein